MMVGSCSFLLSSPETLHTSKTPLQHLDSGIVSQRHMFLLQSWVLMIPVVLAYCNRRTLYQYIPKYFDDDWLNPAIALLSYFPIPENFSEQL